MFSKACVTMSGVGKFYRYYGHGGRPRTMLMEWCTRRFHHAGIWALRDVTCTFHSGVLVGVAGENGSGKSTFLQILGGLRAPTEGEVWRHGRIGYLSGAMAGFHSELTGQENLWLGGGLMGMSRAQIATRWEEILDWADLPRPVWDQPLKYASTGMQSRLAIALYLAHARDVDIVLWDEVLSNVDASFRDRCLDYVRTTTERWRQVAVVITHDAGVLTACHRVVRLIDGRLAEEG